LEGGAVGFKRKQPKIQPDLIDVARSHLDIGADPHAVLDLLMDATVRLVDILDTSIRKRHALSNHIGKMMDRLNNVVSETPVEVETPAVGVLERTPVPKLKP
jgi:hypothetical protein